MFLAHTSVYFTYRHFIKFRYGKKLQKFHVIEANKSLSFDLHIQESNTYRDELLTIHIPETAHTEYIVHIYAQSILMHYWVFQVFSTVSFWMF